MKKSIIILFVFLFTSIAYAKVNVIVSILPQKAFVSEIGGDKVNLTLLIPKGSNPNHYEPKASQMEAVTKADLFFTINGHFEKGWLPRLKDQNTKMEIIDCTLGIERLDWKYNKKMKKDIHVWTIPKNIETIAKNIYEALVKYDAKNKNYYKQNYDKFVKKARKTDKKIQDILSDVKDGEKFMVFHPAWGYFAEQYKLEQIAIEKGGKEPKPHQLRKMIDKAREYKVKAILTQPEFSQKGAKVIANELDIKVIGITPLNPKWSKNLIKLANAIANK